MDIGTTLKDNTVSFASEQAVAIIVSPEGVSTPSTSEDSGTDAPAPDAEAVRGAVRPAFASNRIDRHS